MGALDGPLQKELNKVPPERRYQRMCVRVSLVRYSLTRSSDRVVLYEAMTRMVLRFCSFLPHSTAPTPISSVTTIIDLDQVSLTSMWTWRKHLQEASTLATANYPETLSTIVVVNSPPFFPTVWGWIKVRQVGYNKTTS